MSRARKPKPAKLRKPASLTASELGKLEVIERRLQRARHVVHCIEFAVTAQATELELGPVAFVAVDLIDRVLDDLAPFVAPKR